MTAMASNYFVIIRVFRSNYDQIGHLWKVFSQSHKYPQSVFHIVQSCNMPKTNFCRGQRPLLSQALVKLGNLHIVQALPVNAFCVQVHFQPDFYRKIKRMIFADLTRSGRSLRLLQLFGFCTESEQVAVFRSPA